MLPPSSDISNTNVQFGFKIKNGMPSWTEQNEKKMVQKNEKKMVQKIPPPPPRIGPSKIRFIVVQIIRRSKVTFTTRKMVALPAGITFFFLQIGRREG